MRVSKAPAADAFSFDERTIGDFGKLELRVNGNTIQLTLMEAELLRHLVRNSGRIVSRKAILEEVWGLHEDTDTRAIDNFIVRLRRYIEDDPAKPKHLLTVRGAASAVALSRQNGKTAHLAKGREPVTPSWVGRVPHLKPGQYADGMPLH